MMAMVVASLGSSSSLVLLAGIVVTLGLAVLVAYWSRPQVKRVVSAALLAVVLASIGTVTVRGEDEFVISDPCKRYEPWSPMWLLLGCFWP